MQFKKNHTIYKYILITKYCIIKRQSIVKKFTQHLFIDKVYLSPCLVNKTFQTT